MYSIALVSVLLYLIVNIESMTNPRQQFDERKGSKLTDTELELLIVEKKLRHLKLNKAVGMDGINTNILKALSEEISLPLCMIFRELCHLIREQQM